MKRAPEIVQIGGWRLRDGAYGKGDYDLTHSQLPAKLMALTEQENVDDFCAERDSGGRGIQKFIPYEEMDAVLMDGDILVYMDRRGLSEMPCLDMPKQRGWHGEIAYKKMDGAFYQQATWGGEPREWKCANNADDRKCQTPNVKNPIIGIYRLELNIPEAHERQLKCGTRFWAEIFSRHTFPTPAQQFGIDRYLDPADFGTVADIEAMAPRIIRQEEVKPVTCIQWAYQVLCLAINVPLSRTMLRRLGEDVEAEYEKRYAAKLGWMDNSILPAGKIPYVPYTPAETAQSFLDTYGNGLSLVEALTSGHQLGDMLGVNPSILIDGAMKDAGEDIRKRLAAQLAAYFVDVARTGDRTRPLYLDGRSDEYRHVMPIQPFCEVRNPTRPDNLGWSYIATAVGGDELVRA